MCKVSITDENGTFKNCIATKETISQILEYFNINPKTKIVYMNGKIISKERMNRSLPDHGTVHIAIKNKSIR